MRYLSYIYSIMNSYHFKKPPLLTPEAGLLLIADPFLKDSHFMRTVILLCEHSPEGTLGFVLNQQTLITLNEVYEMSPPVELRLHIGGPVQTDTLHMIHQSPQHLEGKEISKNIYWGGKFESLGEIINEHPNETDKVKLFIGYSGWGTGQLEAEIKEGTWHLTKATSTLVFNTEPTEIWSQSISLLGEEYGYLKQLPYDPQMN